MREEPQKRGVGWEFILQAQHHKKRYEIQEKTTLRC